jgi:proteasome accessory factor A
MERLFGIETEYALTVLDHRGAAVGRELLMNELLAAAREMLPHLPDRASGGVYLQNGARFYVDAGNHPELSTPECAHPDDVVRYVRAGERIVSGLVAAIAARKRPAARPLLLRCNVDYSGSRATWGCHESYLHRVEPARLPFHLVPHLVSRVVYTGAGGFDSSSPQRLDFTLSPRVHHLEREVSGDSTATRGIFHAKDESLSSAGYHRLHVICGESVCSDLALWLKAGATALVVALVEAGVEPGEGVQLRTPLESMRRFASDPTCRETGVNAQGYRVTAIEIQRHYLALARAHARHPAMPSWTEEVCERWADVLDRLESGPEEVATRLDWAIKLSLYRKHAARRGIAWETLPHRGHAAATLHGKETTKADIEAVGPYLAERGLARNDLPAFVRLRRELFELDTRFGQLDDAGVFSTLDRAGVLAHRTAEPSEVDRAVEEPPAVGRARVRGAEVRRLSGRPGRYSCDWRGIWDHDEQRAIDLTDPFAKRANWKEWVPPEEHLSLRSPLFAHLNELHGRAMTLYGEWRHEEAARLFLEAERAARAAGNRQEFHKALFWRATVLHGMGRLAEAETLLADIAAAPAGAVEDGILYKALTRQALIFVETPRPLAVIEESLASAESRIVALGHAAWRSRLLLVRGRLEAARGRHEEALATLRESIEARRGDGNCFAINSHVRPLLSVCFRLGRLDVARLEVDELQSSATEYPRTTDVVLAWARSELARRSGDAGEAVRWAREASRVGQAGSEHVLRMTAGESLVRAHLCAGGLTRAAWALARLPSAQEAESGLDRYALLLLHADYQLARARHAAGLSMVDATTGLQIVSSETAPLRPAAARRRLGLVAEAYDRVLKEGHRLDELLECRAREREITARREEIETVSAAIESCGAALPRSRDPSRVRRRFRCGTCKR